MTSQIIASTYAQYDLHLELIGPMDSEENVVEGFAIRSEDLGSFLADMRKLVRRYGGVTYGDLEERDVNEASLNATVRASATSRRVADIDDTIVV